MDSIKEVLYKLDLEEVWWGNGNDMKVISPITNKDIAKVKCSDKSNYNFAVDRSIKAFKIWREVPAPKRGEIVRQIGNAFREKKDLLGALITIEMGKILEEGKGEIQEVIDIADYAVGQSRMLYGVTTHSERNKHRMYEQWHPVGPVGVVTAFNFPAAVWAWNAMIALICGDSVVWKPSSKTPLTAIAMTRIAWSVLMNNDLPLHLLSLVIGDRKSVGDKLVNDERIPLISATGSVEMGKAIYKKVANRMGRPPILELGGNNAIIITQSADIDMASRAILFGAVGTAGQRCTTTRRLIVHENIYDDIVERLKRAYKQIKIGNPLKKETLMGPLIDKDAVKKMQKVVKILEKEDAVILPGGEIDREFSEIGTYVNPLIALVNPDLEIMQEETFAPILYITNYETLEEAIEIHNNVPQGLSSSIFTKNIRESELFLSHLGSDCGIANVNIGTSGAEIGLAFGGEKDTGYGRESGSDVWKNYMRRQTNTINWSTELPLAQGIYFE
jgi:aldehyde dehydrogenase (NAD+)